MDWAVVATRNVGMSLPKRIIHASPTPRSHGMTTTTTTANPYPDVPLPAGARQISSWFDYDDSGMQARAFYGTKRGERVQVDVDGIQFADGRVDPTATIRSSLRDDALIGSLYAAELRELAAHALAAADELDGLEAQR
jgi:CubicO group peptidase (beta-lactamase class C family)